MLHPPIEPQSYVVVPKPQRQREYLYVGKTLDLYSSKLR